MLARQSYLSIPQESSILFTAAWSVKLKNVSGPGSEQFSMILSPGVIATIRHGFKITSTNMPRWHIP